MTDIFGSRYRLHYDIDENDDHTMIVTGIFNNIIVASPLMDKLSAAEREWILAHISKDSYFYQLVLKTKEGFSFMNMLRFCFDAMKCGYFMKYSYDLLTDTQTLVICGVPDCEAAEDDMDDSDADETVQEPENPDEQAGNPEAGGEHEKTAGQMPAMSDDRSENETTAVSTPDAALPGTADGNIVTVRYGKLRKKAQTIKLSKIMGSAGGGQGKVTYAKTSGNRKITINKKTGRVSIKKGLKKGDYKVSVKLKPSGNSKNRNDAVRSITFIVRVI